ncbi:MAG TPA: FHA domain-containing protein [Planctomycetota bacterium]|nr:FHA domain-containing protein [Planctomycetota bacterium]
MPDIMISEDDLRDPAIDDVLALHRSVQPQAAQQTADVKTPFYYNPIFYYSVASVIGGVTVWAITEPYNREGDHGHSRGIPFVSDYLLFGPVAAALGLSIGTVYGLMNRNWKQVLYCGAVGMGVGLVVTLLTTIVADILFGITSMIAVAFMRNQAPPAPGEFPLKGMSFVIFMSGRAIAWSVVSMGAGMGLGIALKSKKLVLNGFVGGMIGGLIGGLFFDPISRFVLGQASDGSVSRFVGIFAVSLFVGIFIGLFENLSKEAWFLMLKGPLTGKQFIVFKNPMLIGSSPKSDIYLFKDPDIAPLHATVMKSGSKYILTDEGSGKGTFVNGKAIDKYVLQSNDVISLGEAVLKYSEKTKGA